MPPRKKKPAFDPLFNNMSQAFGFSPFGQQGIPVFGLNGNSEGKTISQVSTIFENMRWYLISNMRQPLNEAYAELGLIQNICNVPVEDAIRGGVEIKTKQLEVTQINELNGFMEEHEDMIVAGNVMIWNRLFGGAGLVILTDQDPAKPFDISTIKEGSDVEFRDADMWELYWNAANSDPHFHTSSNKKLNLNEQEFNYYGETINASRIVTVKGIRAPSYLRPRLRGWGLSVVETLIRSINQYLKSTDLAFEVLDEFKLDVYKMKNLVNTLMMDGGTEKILKRIQLANMQKNYQHALVLDSEDEYDHKQLSFAGWSDVMAAIRMQVASDMRMPMTKLFGVSSAGFNSGEDDIEVYNGMVEGSIRPKLKRIVIQMIKVRCQQLYGFVPDDLEIDFKPLRIMSSEQEENVKTQKFNRILAAKSQGEITPEEFRDACNKDNLLGIHLEESVIPTLDTDDTDVEAEDDSEDKVTDSGSTSTKSQLAAKDSKEAKNSLESKTIPPYSSIERANRMFANSAAFDRASYAADGGDAWIDERRKTFFETYKDEAIAEKAKKASVAAFGEERWQFVAWMYKKLGGT